MSKGSGRRPLQVPKEKFDENWDRIFSKKKEEPRQGNTQNNREKQK